MTKPKTSRVLIILFLLADFTFSFIQYYNTPLYGDIQGSVLPEKQVQKIFDAPLGFKVINAGERHSNPNRFFAQYLFTKYFQKVPIWLQNFVSPISSVYLASAIAKIFVQITFIFSLSLLISGANNPLSITFLRSAVIVTPLFQVYGYWSRMGIVDQSIAYTFFYAVPLVLLMLLLLPILRHILYNKSFKIIHYPFLIPFTIILPLSGPLIPAIIILLTFFILTDFMFSNSKNGFKNMIQSIPLPVYLLLIPASLWSVYSLFLGFFDSNYQSETISLYERFSRLPKGVYSQIFHSLGFPLMLSIIGLNMYLFKKEKLNDAKKMQQLLKWIGIFALVYILLLPFGGYRPYIVRYDTFMPVNVSLIFFFGITTFLLLKNLTGNLKKRYSFLIVVVILTFTFSDYKGIGKNKCERAAFEKMATSDEDIISIPKDCFVMSWQNNFDYKQSEKRAETIHFWNITNRKILFYNEQ